jgi:hypothetical protein
MALKSIRKKEKKKKATREKFDIFLVHTLFIKEGDTMRNKRGAIEH